MATEKRLIDAKAGKKLFCAIAKPAEYNGVIHLVVPISEIDKLPTVDAVEVVRCKDCINGIYDEVNDRYKCVKSAEYDPEFGDWLGFVSYCNADYYCADGDRKPE